MFARYRIVNVYNDDGAEVYGTHMQEKIGTLDEAMRFADATSKANCGKRIAVVGPGSTTVLDRVRCRAIYIAGN